MNCKEFEQEIYLYSELTASQKASVDEHIGQCTACEKLFDVILAYQAITDDIAEDKPELRNHALLTSNIMQAVAKSAQKQTGVRLIFESLFVKYSLVTASFALIVFFIAEQFTPNNSSYKRMSAPQTVTLNSSSVAKVLQSQKEKKKVSLYACVKSRDCNNSLIENFKQKKF